MKLSTLMRSMLPAVEEEMRAVVDLVQAPAMPGSLPEVQGSHWQTLHHMLAYHLGWTEAGAEAGGKRIRPLLLLLVTAAAGADWHSGLPAGAAVELLHNFSLIHDDIEDNSPLRRGRATLWTIWGIPQTINTGDVMYTLASLALLRLQHLISPDCALEAAQIFFKTCLALTQGQFLDIAYEAKSSLPMEAYWPMVTGKTASLLAACADLGACIANTSQEIRQAYQQFGVNLGLAFQVQDDLLGIWGSEEQTGKSVASDLLSGKKSLPVLYGLQQEGPFAQRWRSGAIQPDEVEALAVQLQTEGAYDYTKDTARVLTARAVQALEAAAPQGDAGEALLELAESLLGRSV
jgi:geranylgeranyl diphosphate synthase type I